MKPSIVRDDVQDGAARHPTTFNTLTVEYILIHLPTTKSEESTTELELDN